ncbi:hypothetical protein J1C67_11470 [Clostridium gasigenes]|uniref:hypothetical protein n=1 Tax=Clostridium gasigenes TaxID=94869 RepID=UPI0014384D12|nr:hypothetical protein [Clostridium gasigenes]NKF07205.1 hypothetical protein [Clostridium gasigenes]QSW18187.1 hypothetical protein J1C67_11470 [Clostridium gasigenes]
MKKIKNIALSLISLIAINGTVAFASNIDRPFTKFSLPANYGNCYSPTQAFKVNNTNYSYVKPTSMIGTSRVSFWISNTSLQPLTGVIDLPVGSSFNTMYYYSYPGTNLDVRLSCENAEYSSVNASVTGLVDYD